MARTTKLTMAPKRRKNDLSAYPLRTQMEIIVERMKKQNVDPLDAVIRILDPDHDEIIKPTLSPEPRQPKDPSKGVFRVIFSEVIGKICKLSTCDVQAKNGYNAYEVFLSSADNKIKELKHKLRVVGMQCVIIPHQDIEKHRNDWTEMLRTGEFNSMYKIALDSLIAELEIFEDADNTVSLDKFMDDDESNK